MTGLLIIAAAVAQTVQPPVAPAKTPSPAPFARAAFAAQVAAPAPPRPVAVGGDEALRLAAQARALAGAPPAPPRQQPIR